MKPTIYIQSTEISRLHKRLKFRLNYSTTTISKKIVDCFEQCASVSPDFLELVKNKVDHEDLDFLDLADLADDLERIQRLRLLQLFRLSGPKASSFLRVKVISDLDNTAIENGKIAPVPVGSRDHSPVNGFIDFANSLTSFGQTSLTFVSARPKEMEFISILSTKRALKENGLKNFTFMSGELKGPINYLLARASGSKSRLIKSCICFARLKEKCYHSLLQVYPACRFIFLGDDTQGDYIFACMLVRDYHPLNIAVIRKIAREGDGVHPFPGGLWDDSVMPRREAMNHPRIIYHSSYEDAYKRLLVMSD